MNCDSVRKNLREAPAGNPPPASDAAHLVTCEGCRHYAEELNTALSPLRAPFAARSAADWTRFNNSVYAALPVRRAPRHAPAWRVIPTTVATAIALFLLLLNPTPVIHHAPTGRPAAQPAADLSDNVIGAVYSDYDFYQDVDGIAPAEADEASQTWSAQHLLHSGSPTEYEAAPALLELTPEERDSVYQGFSPQDPGVG